MIMLDPTTAVVHDSDDLNTAVSTDNGINYVYLGSDIVLSRPITIYPGKPSLVIDGLFADEGPPVMHTFTDMNFSDQGNTIAVRTASEIQLTFQNMVMVGRNFFGIPCIYAGTGFNNLSLTYRNVTYSGPQMTYNWNGLTRYIDCDITILTRTSTANEVGEVCRVELGGTTTIEKLVKSDAVFWFRGPSALNSFTVLADADVSITTPNYFMYTTYPVPYTIQPGARFTLDSFSGISYGTGHRVASFLVDENASFRYYQTGNDRTISSIHLDGAFTVNSGAEVYMQGTFSGSSSALIRFETSAARFYVNNPKSFVLYRNNAPALSFAVATQFALSGGQLNFWLTATPFPDAGTFSDAAPYRWLKLDQVTFEITGSATSSATTVATENFEPEDEPLPALSDLRLQTGRVLSIGRLPLSVDPIINTTRPITGKTTPHAEVRATYTSGSYFSLDGTADEEGEFFVLRYTPTPFSVFVTVTANTPFLLTSTIEEVEEEGELTLSNAPTSIRFLVAPLSQPPHLLPRETPILSVLVSDTRVYSTKWDLMLSVPEPLTTDKGHILPGGVVFAEDGEINTLGALPFVIHTDGPNGGEPAFYPLNWPPNEGVLGHATEPLWLGEAYSTRLIWDLVAHEEE